MSQQRTANGRNAEGQSGVWYCCRNLATFRLKSFARGRSSGSALTRPIILTKRVMWWDLERFNPQSSLDSGSHLTYHDTKGKDVHLLIVTFPCKVEGVWAAFGWWMCLVTILATCHVSSQAPSSRGFLRPCNASCGQVCGVLTVVLWLAFPEKTLCPDSSPPSPAWPGRNLPPPQTGSNQRVAEKLQLTRSGLTVMIYGIKELFYLSDQTVVWV